MKRFSVKISSLTLIILTLTYLALATKHNGKPCSVRACSKCLLYKPFSCRECDEGFMRKKLKFGHRRNVCVRTRKQDINECLTNNGGCKVIDAGATCENTLGSYTCRCTADHFFDGKTCRNKVEVIQPTANNVNQVTGLVYSDGKLYVLRDPSLRAVDVHSGAPFAFERTITVSDMNEEMNYIGMTYSDVSKCLYIADNDATIFQVSVTGNNAVTTWFTSYENCRPKSLSVTSENTLLVTCSGNALVEYTLDGWFVSGSKIDLVGLTIPNHAIRLSNNQFLVIHGHYEASLARVCIVNIVDTEGHAGDCYGSQPGSDVGKLGYPVHFVRDKNGLIYVADRDNNRIEVLKIVNNKPERVRYVDVELSYPRTLYMDDSSGRLFAGEGYGTEGRIFAIHDP